MISWYHFWSLVQLRFYQRCISSSNYWASCYYRHNLFEHCQVLSPSMWQCHNQLTAFFVHISRHYCFQLIAVLFSFVSDTAGEHWRRNWLNVEKLPIADAEETEGMRKIFVSRCLVLSSCLLQQLWLMKARKGQKHLWQTDQRNLKPDKPTGATTTPASWTELPQPR